MDYENDIPTDEYEPELYDLWYSPDDTNFSDYVDDGGFEYEALDEPIEDHKNHRQPRWTPTQVVFILISVVLVAAVLVFVILPWLQFTVAPTPLYMPPPSTPLSQL